MKISVYTCSYEGREDLTKLCLNSLELQTRLPDEVILVVDSEREKELFRYAFENKFSFPLSIVSSGKKGVAAARNKGVELSTGDLIVTIDSDAHADPNWLQELVKAFETNPAVVMVGGPVLPVFHGNPIDQKLNWIIGCTTTDPPTERPIGCNMAVRREVIDSVGKFDESLGRIREKLAIGEETDFILRTVQFYGKERTAYIESAIVNHETPKNRTTLPYILKRSYEEGYTKIIIGKRYNLKLEGSFLTYYLTHLDPLTLIVVFSTALGYCLGFLFYRKQKLYSV
jgi:GT2 family glycosyltransferase